jgi:hypothetical protein
VLAHMHTHTYAHAHLASLSESNKTLDHCAKGGARMLKSCCSTAQEVIFSFQSVLSNIERDAKHEDSAHFRHACRTREIENLLIKFSTELMFVYKIYSGMDAADAEQTAGESSSLDSLNLVEFITMVRDAGIEDVNFTKPEIINIFIYVQDDGSIVNEPQEDGAEAGDGRHAHNGGAVPAGQPMSDDTEMDYGEFCEALCGCACYKTLDPYITMPQKLEFLIIKNIVPLFHALRAGTITPISHQVSDSPPPFLPLSLVHAGWLSLSLSHTFSPSRDFERVPSLLSLSVSRRWHINAVKTTVKSIDSMIREMGVK